MKSLIGAALGAYFAVASLMAYLHFRPKSQDTEIRCAWCGEPVPYKVAINGIGAVNREMQLHMQNDCELHPMRGLKRDLVAARRLLVDVRNKATPGQSDPLGKGLVEIREMIDGRL